MTTLSAIITAPLASTTVRTGSRIAATAPMADADVRAVVAPAFSVDITAPMATVSTHLGLQALLTAPMATVESSATVPRMLRADLVAPMATVETSSTAGRALQAILTAPMATLAARTGAWAQAVAPVPTVEASASTGRNLRAILTAPMARVEASASTRRGFVADITAPVAYLLPSIQVDVTAPMARASAQAAQVIQALYEAYAVNLHTTLRGPNQADAGNEVTHYTDFPFTQIVRFGDRYYGVATDGLYLLEGDTDAGAPINWGVRTSTTDFGTQTKKTPVSCYVGGRLGPSALFTVFTGEKLDNHYSYSTPRGATAQNYRQPFGRGLAARYYAFQIEGDGELALDDLKFEVNQLTRSI
jgi:hypothetical protein